MLKIIEKCRKAKSSEVKIDLMWSVAKWNKVKWTKKSEVEWGEVLHKEGGGKGGTSLMEKVFRSSMWWEVKDWDESVSELMIVKKIQETVHSTVLLGCFYLLYMLYYNLSRVVGC